MRIDSHDEGDNAEVYKDRKIIDFKTAFSYIDDIRHLLISKNIFTNESSAELDSIEDLLIYEKIRVAKQSSIEDYFKN